MSFRVNYDEMVENNPTMQKHVDNMYDLINEYATEHKIPIAYDDKAERLVEAIATYLTESKEQSK